MKPFSRLDVRQQLARLLLLISLVHYGIGMLLALFGYLSAALSWVLIGLLARFASRLIDPRHDATTPRRHPDMPRVYWPLADRLDSCERQWNGWSEETRDAELYELDLMTMKLYNAESSDTDIQRRFELDKLMARKNALYLRTS